MKKQSSTTETNTTERLRARMQRAADQRNAEVLARLEPLVSDEVIAWHRREAEQAMARANIGGVTEEQMRAKVEIERYAERHAALAELFEVLQARRVGRVG